ncbi:lysylphosphatidylglycerol synthase domain-containing protein [Sphaerisporangium sp. NPDC088356]|uniref:lysylphosphatidylglycerol synthase domain-containing protein n=1 Tax=Sphaerisporangium sp. NPDC088356 TaxID=3154871 RepID=UPI00341826DC
MAERPLAAGRVPDHWIAGAALAGGLSIAAFVVITGVGLYWDRAAVKLGHLLDRAARLLPRRFRRADHATSAALHRLRADTAEVVNSNWPSLTLGMVGYQGFQAILLGYCLHATGVYPGAAATLAAFALNRVLTTVLITPSGSGISEFGTAALLVSFGYAPAPVGAAVLLFWFWAPHRDPLRGPRHQRMGPHPPQAHQLAQEHRRESAWGVGDAGVGQGGVGSGKVRQEMGDVKR